VTPKEQADFAAERAKVTNADQAVAAANKAGDSAQAAHVQAINASMEAGHAVEIVHKGVIREGGPTPEKPVARGERRAEQEAAYVAEAMGAVPEDIREQHQKTFFPTRWLKAGKQITARSLDKVLANIKNAVDMSADKKVTLPYEVDAAGKLTHAGWSEAVQDLKDYWTNQDRGFRGDGEKLSPETRTKDVGQSIPPEDPRGPAAVISPARTDFLNLVQGLNIPETTRSPAGAKVPGNIKGQLLAEMQGKKPATPAGFTAADVKAKTFKPIAGELTARSIMEVNPLRNELRAAGAPVENLIEVTENINRENIESVTPRPDMAGRGGSTDITRGGFSVSSNPEFRAEFDKVLKGEKGGESFNFDGTVFSPKNKDVLVVTLASENFAADKVTPEAVQAFLDKHHELASKNPNVKAGLFRLADGRISADLNVVVPKSKEAEARAIGAQNNQESVFDVSSGKPIPTGGTGETILTRPSTVEKVAGKFSVSNVDEAAKLLKQSPEEWAKTTQAFKGGLTQEAYRLGLGLKDRADLTRLSDLAKKAGDDFKSAMADGDTDAAMAHATKGQFYREAWEAAQGIASAKGGLERYAKESGTTPKPPFLMKEGESFSPATAKGQELEKQGFDFRVTGEKGNRTVNVFKNGEPIGYATSKQIDPKTADLAMIQIDKSARGKGLGEVVYREMFAQLQKDGVELVEGMAVAPEPIALRNKIFEGRFERLEGGGEPMSVKDALLTAADIKKGTAGTYVPGIDVTNRIRPEDRFSPGVVERRAGGFDVVSRDEDGNVVGKLQIDYTGQKSAVVAAVDVDEAHQRKGIAMDLYKRAKRELRAHGVDTLRGSLEGSGPLQIRESVFGKGNTKYTAGGPLSTEEARKIMDEDFGRVIAESKFSPALAGAEPSKASQEKARKAWVEQGTESPYFKKWFGKSEVVDPARPGDPQVVYHGTTHEFTQFDNKNTNIENDLGKGFYFTSDPHDVGKNYAGEGPDLTSRLEQEAERIMSDSEHDISHDEAMDVARKKLKGSHGGATMPAYLAIKKPFRLGSKVSGSGQTVLEGRQLDKFLQHLQENTDRYSEADGHALVQDVRENLSLYDESDSVRASELVKTIKDSEHIAYAMDDNTGEFARAEIIRQTIEDSGFDGIIDETVSDKFRGMNLSPDTIHYIAFKPEQIKSATGNVGTFRKTSQDVRFSVSKVPTDKEVTAALSEDKKSFVGAHRDLEPGTPVGLRIDIPAFTRHGTYVVTVHEKAKGGSVGKRIGYDSVATVDNPTFFSNERGAEKIREGAPKFPIATVEGEFNPSRSIPQNLEGWTEVGFNPNKHSYFYEKGTDEPVVGGSQAVSAGNSVFVKDAKFGNKEDFAFSVEPEKKKSETVLGKGGQKFQKQGTPEFNAYVENKIEKSKTFPEAFPLEFQKGKDGNYKSQWDGDALPVAKPYGLLKSDLAEKSGSKEAFRDALAKKLQREYHKAKADPAIAEGEFWYSTFRDKIGKVLGDDTKFFCELLGATSAQQAVGPNFKDALAAYNQFKTGAYNSMIEKYREGKKKFNEGDLEEFSKETGKTGKKADYAAFMGWWAKKHNLLPTKANGKKFGMNSRAVMKVLDRSWLEGVEGPKTPNFTGNLSGTTFKATIDVWAMRSLTRLAGEDSGKPWRIQPANESGVSDPDFYFGQDAFQKAADDLGIKADALQAIIWFAEKDLWEKNGWTAAAGKAKSDYNTLLDRTTRTPEGLLDLKEADVKPKVKKTKVAKTLEAGDIKKK
jgi:GNAT superfamily N-acetyltransferase